MEELKTRTVVGVGRVVAMTALMVHPPWLRRWSMKSGRSLKRILAFIVGLSIAKGDGMRPLVRLIDTDIPGNVQIGPVLTNQKTPSS